MDSSRDNLKAHVASGDGAEIGGIPGPHVAMDLGDVERQFAELENIYRTAPVGLLFLDTDLRYVRINERLAAINGLPVAAHIGRTIWEVLPEIAPVVAVDYQQVIASGEPIIDKEVRGHTKANPNVEHVYLVSYYPVKDQHGRVGGITAVVQDITAKKQIEEALRQSERRFALFMRNLPGAAWMKDLEGRYVYANQEAERIFQISLDELRGRTDQQVFPPDIAAQFQTNDQRAITSGDGFQTIETLPQQDGLHYSLVSKFPVVDDAGNPVLVGGVAFDITEQRRAEDAQRETEESFRVVAETAGDGIVKIDQQGRIQFANTAIRKIFGYEPQELVGQSLTALMPAYLHHAHETGLQNYLRTGRKHLSWEKVELPGQHKAGRQIPLEISFGEFVRKGERAFTGIIRDVSDRKRAERRLAAQHSITRILSEFSILSEIAPRVLYTIGEQLEWQMGGFWTVDTAAQVLRCVETWHGTAPSRSEFEARSREMSFQKGIGLPGRVWASGKAYWIPDLASDNNFFRAPHAVQEEMHSAFAFPILRNSEVLGVMDFFSPEIREPDSELLQTMEVIGSQIGQFLERKSLEEQVRQAQKLESLGVLAGGIAHDFNNLLTGILGNISLGTECLPPGHPACSFLMDAVKATESAALLTRQMLAYTGKGQVTIETIDLSELIRETGALIRRSIPKSVQLHLDLAPHAIIDADGAQLRQLIMNLIINAAESIGEGNSGIVLIATGTLEADVDLLRTSLTQGGVQPGKFVSLEVSDTGCGMDQETLSRIFDPFFTTKFTGRGLGLAAVRGIVHSHKGALRVESTVGVGTAFKVLLPASAGLVEKASSAERRPSLTGAGTILVVDDEDIVRKIAKRSLERYGYRVMLASSGNEAVTLFQNDPDAISLVLLDLTMPGLSGEETLRRLQGIRSGVKVVLSTGYGEVEATKRFAGTGLAGFLPKPYTAGKLAERIKSALSGKPPKV